MVKPAPRDTMWNELTQTLARFPRLSTDERTMLLQSLHAAGRPDEGPAELLEALQSALNEPLALREGLETPWHKLMSTLAPGLYAEADTDALIEACEKLGDWYLATDRANPLRELALRAIAAVGTDEAIETLVELLVTDPPQADEQIELVFASLWQHPKLPVDVLFPRLLAGLEHQSLAALILELASEAFRRRLVRVHPAAGQAPKLTVLFGGLVESLGRLEEKPSEYASSPEELSKVVARSTGLATAIADSLGLIRHEEAIPQLRKAFLLTHRRVRAEAAAAVARLGDHEGIAELAALAADPGIRIRALHYLAELGASDEAPDEYRTPQAQAAGELALRLAHPSLFGLAPSELDLVDARELRWPGFDQPVMCYLFRYQYQHPRGLLQGIGIVGPMTHALKVPPIGLPPADIYAIYCGWSVEHPELVRTPVDETMPDALENELVRLVDWLEENGYEEIKPIEHIHFFGETIWILMAQHDDRIGTVVFENDALEWYPITTDAESLAPEQVDYLHVGRKILQTFNAPEALE